MSYDPNRDLDGRHALSRDGGMWGWIIGIAAVLIIAFVVIALVDRSPEVAKTEAPATQAGERSTVGSAPADGTPRPGANGVSQPAGAKK